MALIFAVTALLWALAHVELGAAPGVRAGGAPGPEPAAEQRAPHTDSRARVGGGAGTCGGVGSGAASRGVVGGVRRRLARFRRRREGYLIELATEVATRLRSGATSSDAWAEAAARAGLDPSVDSAGVPVALGEPGREDVRAAWVMAAELGAPLADILDECALAFTHAEENASARAIALAGPRASARLLAALPLAGVALGSLLGADPLAQLLSGGAGHCSAFSASRSTSWGCAGRRGSWEPPFGRAATGRRPWIPR